jgi:hypothetical protein
MELRKKIVSSKIEYLKVCIWRKKKKKMKRNREVLWKIEKVLKSKYLD